MKSNNLEIVLDTPWKVVQYLKQLLCTPLVYIYLKACGVSCLAGAKFFGRPMIFKHRGSVISIGKNFENRNWLYSNPLGVNHPTIITTWSKDAVIQIGNNVGISGGTICATQKIKVGNNCLIGANCTIIDTDFHPIKARSRRYKKDIKGKEIIIGDNVFIGMNTTILKGVRIGMNSVIGAQSTIRSDIPANSIYNNEKIIPLKK